jgi:RNA polymerase sigma factor (TIGR02999 family)
MQAPEITHITDLLTSWRNGNAQAENQLMAALYPLLKRQAVSALSKCAPGKLSLSATDLLHESYFRLIEQRAPYQNRAHFMAVSACTLRRVLLDLLREREAQKRGSAFDFVSIDWIEPDQHASAQSPLHLTQLINGLEQLQQRDPEAARVLELRMLGGLNNEDAAEVMGISVATAGRRFAFARAWLAR